MNVLLENWLDANGVAGSALAERIDVTPQHFSKLRRGRITVSLEIAARIERATAGAVPAVSWLNMPDRPALDKLRELPNAPVGGTT